MSGSDIEITGPSGSDVAFGAYLATPAGGEGPGIVVIQEIFGINKFVRASADWLAAEGFMTLAPDLFWRQEPGVQLTDQTQEDWGRAFALMQGMDQDKAIEDLTLTLDHLRGLNGCAGKAGCIGYCLGGKLAYLMACRSGTEASVGYYGVYIQDFLGEAGNISKPLMLHMAGKDQFVPPEAQAAITGGLAGHGQVTLHVYADDDHAFARPGGEHYSEASAALANQRTIDFLRANLG